MCQLMPSLMEVDDFQGPFASGVLYFGESALPDSRNLLQWPPAWCHPSGITEATLATKAGTEIPELRCSLSPSGQMAWRAQAEAPLSCSPSLPLTHPCCSPDFLFEGGQTKPKWEGVGREQNHKSRCSTGKSTCRTHLFVWVSGSKENEQMASVTGGPSSFHYASVVLEDRNQDPFLISI